MIPIRNENALLIFILVLLIAAGAILGYAFVHAHTPVRIGVLLPLTGDIELREPLEWARENINRQGGIGGRPVELVYGDTGLRNTDTLAEELLADDSVQIVIGPPTSDDVFALAPAFVGKKKILISPVATSGDISRAFGTTGYFWRTTKGDVAQVGVMISLIGEKGGRRIALLAENTSYGKTFYDWAGFFATESGLDLVSIQRFEPGSHSLDAAVSAALEADPGYIVAACGPADAAEIRQAIDRSGKPVELILADAAVSPVLISTLGPSAEGIEGTSPSADPSTGFAIAYQEKFGHAPTDYAAPVYDALLLAAYITARQDATFFESPDESARKIVYGSDTAEGWDAQGVHETLRAIQEGKTPDISGASGPLDYDIKSGSDPVVTYYSHWVVEDGDFRTVGVYGSARPGETVARGQASKGYQSSLSASPGEGPTGPARKDFRAVIVGPSQGWSNYRHEADALGIYTLLRANGVPDDHIILMLYDDIPTLPENPLKGDVHNLPRGPNLRSGAVVDYAGPQVNTDTLENVLTGKSTGTSPVVLDSSAETDVFVYIASHGIPGGISFSPQDIFTTEDFTRVTDTMSRDRKYRQMVFMVDTCFGESLAARMTAPGIIYFTGASGSEPSLAAVYDMDIRQWLSDEFTHEAASLIQADPQITFRELYPLTYEQVTGSHVRLVTTANVSTLDQPVRAFLSP
jgi:ABC-type branched-subunit amino acid transport system substrate-binding protein